MPLSGAEATEGNTATHLFAERLQLMLIQDDLTFVNREQDATACSCSPSSARWLVHGSCLAAERALVYQSTRVWRWWEELTNSGRMACLVQPLLKLGGALPCV